MSVAPPIPAITPDDRTPVRPRIASRLVSLDAFRGLTIIGMLIVNNPGDSTAAFAELRHSPWHGWTIADLIFPFFLFVVGITTHLSLDGRRHRGDDDAAIRRQIRRRGALIFVVGLLLNWFPFYQYGAIAGHEHATFFDHVVGRVVELRILGVLQRIGIAYIAAALLSRNASNRRIVVTAAALLVGYWMAMTLLPVPGEGGAIGLRLIDDPARTLSAWVDRTTLDWSRWGMGNHLWQDSRVFDPEGLLSTIPSIATTLIGVLAGRWIGASRSLGDRLNGLFAAGALLTMMGLAWGVVFPINKNLWTSSYVLFTAGVACTTLATIAWLVDVRKSRWWTEPFVAFGMNPIAAYVGSELSAVLFDSTIKFSVDGRLQSVHALAYEGLASWLPPGIASLGYSLLFVGLWWCILRALQRRQIVLKI